MKNLFNSIFDVSIISQSLPSILITLLGMFVTGEMFKNAVMNKSLANFPFVLLSSAVLGFKSSIELAYVMHITRLRNILLEDDFKKAVFTNSCFILLESFGVSIFSGIIGILSIYQKNQPNISLYLSILTSSILTCVISTFVFIIFFILALEISIYFSIDPENILMPLLNTVDDLIVVKLLVVSALETRSITAYSSILILLLFIAMSLFFYFYTYNAENLLPLQSLESISISFSLNIFSGLIMEKSSAKYPMIAAAFPVFGGMSASIAFIFLHKVFSITQEQISSIPPTIYCSLILVSFLISVMYMSLSHILQIGFTIEFSICFIFLFTIQVLVLLKFVDFMIKFIKKYDLNISSNTIPILSATADFFAGLLLLFTFSVILGN